MILLDATTRSLEIDLNSSVATNQLPFVACYVDINQSTIAMSAASMNTGASNNTTAVTLVAAPGASTTRQIKFLSIKNSDTAAVTLWIQVNDNATLREIWKGTLAVGDTLQYLDKTGFSVLDSSGRTKTSNGVGIPGTSTDNAVVRWDGTSGDAIQNSAITADDFGNITIDQTSSDSAILNLKSTGDVAHGITSLADTAIYGFFQKLGGTTGGLRIDGYSSGTRAIGHVAVHTTDNTTKNTTADGIVVYSCGLKSGTTIGNAGADANLMVIRNNTTARFIFDGEGDSHQDVGTAWTNFDHLDDVGTLDALAYNVARPDDPIKHKFGEWMMEKRDELERNKLVTFNDDGHHFVNMSKLTMLHTGAIRQLGNQLSEVQGEIGRLQAIEARLNQLEAR